MKPLSLPLPGAVVILCGAPVPPWAALTRLLSQSSTGPWPAWDEESPAAAGPTAARKGSILGAPFADPATGGSTRIHPSAEKHAVACSLCDPPAILWSRIGRNTGLPAIACVAALHATALSGETPCLLVLAATTLNSDAARFRATVRAGRGRRRSGTYADWSLFGIRPNRLLAKPGLRTTFEGGAKALPARTSDRLPGPSQPPVAIASAFVVETRCRHAEQFLSPAASRWKRSGMFLFSGPSAILAEP